MAANCSGVSGGSRSIDEHLSLWENKKLARAAVDRVMVVGWQRQRVSGPPTRSPRTPAR